MEYHRKHKAYIGDHAVELDLEEDMVLQMIKSLYGFSGSDYMWYKKGSIRITKSILS